MTNKDFTAEATLDFIVHRVNDPSFYSANPPCPVFGQCGGCDLQHISPEIQANLKEKWLRKILHRSLPETIHPLVRAEKVYHYRNRITLHHNGNIFGFHKRGSHDLIPISECFLADDNINLQLKAKLDLTHLPATFELRSHQGQGFTQVNNEQNQKLIQIVKDKLAAKKRTSILELYAGSGNLTIPLSEKCKTITAVEGDVLASKEALKNIREKKIKNISFKNAPVLDVCFELIQDLQTFEIIVADPPRDGLLQSAEYIARLAREKIILISCDPIALARDATVFINKGWIFSEVIPIDMFPQTKHIECVSIFLMKSAQSKK